MQESMRNWKYASKFQLWATRTHGISALLPLLQLRRLPALSLPPLDLSVGAEWFEKPNEIIEEKKSSLIRALCKTKGKITTDHLTRAHFLPPDLQPAMLAGSPTSFPSFICLSLPAPGLQAALQHPAAATPGFPSNLGWKPQLPAGSIPTVSHSSWAIVPTASIAMMLSSYTQRLAAMKPAQSSVAFNKNTNPWSIHQGSEICH